MAEYVFQNSPFLGDDSFEETDQPLRLNEALLLDIVQNCKSSASMRELRRDITEIRRRVRDSNDQLRTSGSEDQAVEFSKSYLLAELEQISGSLTIERAHYYIDRLLKSIREVRTSLVNDIN